MGAAGDGFLFDPSDVLGVFDMLKMNWAVIVFLMVAMIVTSGRADAGCRGVFKRAKAKTANVVTAPARVLFAPFAGCASGGCSFK
jgi:hypothetical protein